MHCPTVRGCTGWQYIVGPHAASPPANGWWRAASARETERRSASPSQAAVLGPASEARARASSVTARTHGQRVVGQFELEKERQSPGSATAHANGPAAAWLTLQV